MRHRVGFIHSHSHSFARINAGANQPWRFFFKRREDRGFAASEVPPLGSQRGSEAARQRGSGRAQRGATFRRARRARSAFHLAAMQTAETSLQLVPSAPPRQPMQSPVPPVPVATQPATASVLAAKRIRPSLSFVAFLSPLTRAGDSPPLGTDLGHQSRLTNRGPLRPPEPQGQLRRRRSASSATPTRAATPPLGTTVPGTSQPQLASS